MKIESCSYRELHSHEDRTTAHFAARARIDTIYGGARAITLGKRLLRMNPSSDALSVVADVYSASTGQWHSEFEGWKCPECETTHLGQSAALDCCANQEEKA